MLCLSDEGPIHGSLHHCTISSLILWRSIPLYNIRSFLWEVSYRQHIRAMDGQADEGTELMGM